MSSRACAPSCSSTSSLGDFLAALGLDLLYLGLGAAAFLYAFHNARRRGALLQVGE